MSFGVTVNPPSDEQTVEAIMSLTWIVAAAYSVVNQLRAYVSKRLLQPFGNELLHYVQLNLQFLFFDMILTYFLKAESHHERIFLNFRFVDAKVFHQEMDQKCASNGETEKVSKGKMKY